MRKNKIEGIFIWFEGLLYSKPVYKVLLVVAK